MAEARMTVHECCEALRANGMSIGEAALTDMICAGKMPFGYGMRSERGKAVTLIFRAAFYRWLDDMLGGEAVRAYE